MSNILKYLPSPSEYAAKVDRAIGVYAGQMYAVGSVARKTLYGLGKSPRDYDFVLSDVDMDGYIYDSTRVRLRNEFPDKVKSGAWGHPAGIEVDCEAFTLKLRVQPIDEFLRSVRFAGDGIAVSLKDDRPICVPEYMSLPPVVQIIKTEEVGDQDNAVWLENHLKTLTDFQNELYALVNKDDAGATSKA